jgi:hypothetical protein
LEKKSSNAGVTSITAKKGAVLQKESKINNDPYPKPIAEIIALGKVTSIHEINTTESTATHKETKDQEAVASVPKEVCPVGRTISPHASFSVRKIVDQEDANALTPQNSQKVGSPTDREETPVATEGGNLRAQDIRNPYKTNGRGGGILLSKFSSHSNRSSPFSSSIRPPDRDRSTDTSSQSNTNMARSVTFANSSTDVQLKDNQQRPFIHR